jgi:hypothetical protein
MYRQQTLVLQPWSKHGASFCSAHTGKWPKRTGKVVNGATNIFAGSFRVSTVMPKLNTKVEGACSCKGKR